MPALDKDIDEELLLDVPPPPARPRQPISPLHQNHHYSNHAFRTSSSGGGLIPPPPPPPPAAAHGLGKQRSMPQLNQQHPQQQQQQQQVLPTTSRPKTLNKKNNRSSSTSRIESFHNAVISNMMETEQLRRHSSSFRIIRPSGAGGAGATGATTICRYPASGRNGGGGDVPLLDESIWTETMKDISTAAASTMETLKSALQQAQQNDSRNGHPAPVSCVSVPPQDEIHRRSMNVDTTTSTGQNHHNNRQQTEGITTLLSKWCGINGQNNPSASRSAWEPHMKKMQDAVNKVVDVEQLQQTTHDIWRFASTGGEVSTPGRHKVIGITMTMRKMRCTPKAIGRTFLVPLVLVMMTMMIKTLSVRSIRGRRKVRNYDG